MLALLASLRFCRLETSFKCDRRVLLATREVRVALATRVEAGDERGSVQMTSSALSVSSMRYSSDLLYRQPYCLFWLR